MQVVNDCLQLLSQSEKEAVMLRHDLSAVQCHISAQVEHGVSTENRCVQAHCPSIVLLLSVKHLVREMSKVQDPYHSVKHSL